MSQGRWRPPRQNTRSPWSLWWGRYSRMSVAVNQNAPTAGRDGRRYLQGWCRCAADTAATRRPGRSRSGRLPAACGPPPRGELRWTCRRRPRTQPCHWNRETLVLAFPSPSQSVQWTAEGGLTHRSQPGLSSGGDPWPGSPVPSLHKATSESDSTCHTLQHLRFSNTDQSRESWFQPARTGGPPASGRSVCLSSCLRMDWRTPGVCAAVADLSRHTWIMKHLTGFNTVTSISFLLQLSLKADDWQHIAKIALGALLHSLLEKSLQHCKMATI